jgi:hypothetical protein
MSFITFGTDKHAVAMAPIPAFPQGPTFTMGASPLDALGPVLAPFKYTFIAGAGVGFLLGLLSGVAIMKWKIILLGLGAVIVFNIVTD